MHLPVWQTKSFRSRSQPLKVEIFWEQNFAAYRTVLYLLDLCQFFSCVELILSAFFEGLPTQIQISGWDTQALDDGLFNLSLIRIFDFNLSDMMSFTVRFSHTGNASSSMLQSNLHLVATYFDILQSLEISLFEIQSSLHRQTKKEMSIYTLRDAPSVQCFKSYLFFDLNC